MPGFALHRLLICELGATHNILLFIANWELGATHNILLFISKIDLFLLPFFPLKCTFCGQKRPCKRQ